MRWGPFASLVLLVSCGIGPVAAQYIDFDVDRRGEMLVGAHPSVRLLGMGGLALTVPDENNEINLSDFGGNLAGVASDRQGWTAESWGGRLNNTQDQNSTFLSEPVRQRDRFDQQAAGVDIVYRKDGRRALGVTSTWNGYDARTRYGDNSRVQGPAYDMFCGDTFGRIRAAIGVLLANDNEDLVSTDIFGIQHSSKTRAMTLAAAYPLSVAGLWGGAQVDFDRVRIEGVSADPNGFHDDRFLWRRPATRLRVNLLRPEGSGPLAFGWNYVRLHRTGREEGQIHWSDRFPANPGRVNFAVIVPIFEEAEDGWQTEGRASWRLGPGVLFGGSGRILHFKSNVHESPNSNFVGSRSESQVIHTEWRVAAGTGLTLRSEQLRVGAEGAVGRGKDDQTAPRLNQTIRSRQYELRAGVEYLLPSRLALRAGYQRASNDINEDVAGSLHLSNGGSVGVGYVPRDAAISLDVAGRIWKEKPDQMATLDWKAAAQDLMLSVRVLF